MPELDISSWDMDASKRKAVADDVKAIAIIEGEVLRQEIHEQEFVQDFARDREPTQAETSPMVAFQHLVPAGPLRSLDLEGLNTKGDLIQQLTLALPLNEYNLPEYVYRADLLDFDFVAGGLKGHHAARVDIAATPTVTATTSILSPIPDARPKSDLPPMGDIQDHVAASIMRLQYEEGFPSLASGRAFWQQLPFEPDSAFASFVEYIELGADRAIHLLRFIQVEEAKELFKTYYWQYRVRALELFRIANAQKLRVQRMIHMEDSHYASSKDLLAKVTTALSSIDAEELKAVGFEKLIRAFDTLIKVQRVSAGLPAAGPVQDDVPRAPTTNIIMQQIAQQDPRPNEVEDSDNEELLRDPDTLKAAQDLIIRSNMAKSINNG